MFNNLIRKHYDDNIQLNLGAGGKILATDDVGGFQHELVKIEFGEDGIATKVSDDNPLPVTDAIAEAALISIAAEDFATNAAQTDGTQKTQVVGPDGSAATVTNNKLDVNAIFSGDIEIGAVELKNGTDDTRATVTPDHALKVDGSAVTQPISGMVTAVVAGTVAVSNFPATQPISAAALPLPSGAATEATLAAAEGILSTLLTIVDFDTKTGSLTETAPATDTASSGLNGRLQRIAQRLTSLIALLPTGLGAGGGLKIDGSGTALPITGTVAVTGAGDASASNQTLQITQETAINTVLGLVADAIVAAGATGTVSAKLRRVTQGLEDLKTLIVLAAGTNIIGKVGIDQTTPGTTNGIVVNNGAAAAAVNIQDGGNSITVDAVSLPLPTNAAKETGGNLEAAAASLAAIDLGIPASLGQKLMAASMPVVIASDQGPIPVTATFSPSGTQDVNVTKINGTTVGLANGLPTLNAELTDFTGTFTNGTQTTSVVASGLDGYGNVLISINGTYAAATAVFEGSDDSGTTWYPIQAARDNINVIENGYTSLTNTNQTWQINNPGFDSIRVRSTAVGSGTVNVRLSASAAPGAAGSTVAIATPDNTQLYSNTLNSTGAISGLDTTGYSSIVFQLSGTWAGNIMVEGSGDNSTFLPLLVLNTNEIAMQDVISNNGNFIIKSTTKYIRVNVIQITGTVSVLILGRTVPGINAADSLAYAMDINNNMPLYVSEVNSKKDVSKALIPSDAPNVITGTSNVANGIIFGPIDTSGYQSVIVHATVVGSGITIQTSNDGVNWAGLSGYSPLINASTSTISAIGVYSYPASGKFVRGLQSGSILQTVVVYLRQQPFSPILAGGLGVNLQTIANNTPVTAGVNGLLAVGGNIANGVAPTANPNLIAGIDTSGLTRRILTDLTGRVIGAATDQTGTARPVGVLSPSNNQYNIAAQAVVEVSSYEGQSMIEILAQILLELKISNQYLSELPSVLQTNNASFNEPSVYRNDPLAFN